VAGTGKTYNTINYAVSIVEGKPLEDILKLEYSEVLNRFSMYKSKGLVENVTFHQSYSYEEFIEGIKPTLNSQEVTYTLHDGIFKRFCKRDFRLDFLVSQDVSSQNAKHYRYFVDSISSENIYVKKFKLGTGQDGKVIPIPVALVLNLVESIKANHLTIMDLRSLNFEIPLDYDTTLVKSYNGVIVNLVEKILLNRDATAPRNRVFIIDEINRGNVSNVFGELITLLEPSKRLGNPEALKVRLPYSNEYFGVPNDVYILGTMNSTDRSIVSLDTALRRRFHFVEMLPNYELFKGLYVEGIDVYRMFTRLNLRLEYILGREYLLGHTYFLPLLQTPTLTTLESIFRHNVLPTLQEYFYDDYAKVRLVLADSLTNVEDYQFIVEISPPRELFNSNDAYLKPIYRLNPVAFKHHESYAKI
jgi:5-methylcytosine-specific restriction endonuclease McrBC GTP-binding regulatory subunit McrB